MIVNGRRARLLVRLVNEDNANIKRLLRALEVIKEILGFQVLCFFPVGLRHLMVGQPPYHAQNNIYLRGLNAMVVQVYFNLKCCLLVTQM